MVARVLKELSEDDLYVKGYLHDRIEAEPQVDYGYPQNHLPDVGIASRNMESSLSIAKRQRSAP